MDGWVAGWVGGSVGVESIPPGAPNTVDAHRLRDCDVLRLAGMIEEPIVSGSSIGIDIGPVATLLNDEEQPVIDAEAHKYVVATQALPWWASLICEYRERFKACALYVTRDTET